MCVRISASIVAFALLLAGCEGSTTMTHTFHNRTPDTLVLLPRFMDLPWHDAAEVVLGPEQQQTLYTYDMRGKCQDCFWLDAPMRWIDTVELDGHVWLQYPDDGQWITEISEGRSWIQFDHTLNIGIADVE